MKLNKVNFIRDPKYVNKRSPGKVLPKWKPFEYVKNLQKHFNPKAPYFVVCGDAGGDLPYLAVIDLDGITADKIQKENAKHEKRKLKHPNKKQKPNKYDKLDPDIKKNILQGSGLPDPEDVLKGFMKEFGLENTYIVRTQSGWFHLYYFIDDNGTNLKNKVAQRFYKQCAIDLRPAGGMVYGEGTIWKNSPQPYTCYAGDENNIANIPGWKVAWVAGVINYSVCGMNLGDFISGREDVHLHVPEKDKEFIVWREAMFFLKNLGYGKNSVEKIFTNQPAYDSAICGDQIEQWWEKELDPRRVTAKNEKGESLETPTGKGYWKFGQLPWYINFETDWDDQFQKTIRYIADFNEWVGFRESGYYEPIPPLLIDGKLDDWFDINFEECSMQKKNLGVKRLKAKLFSMLKEYGNYKDLRCINNGILNIKNKVLIPHDSKYLFLSKMEVNYKESIDPTPYIDRVRKAYPIQFERLERFVQIVLHQDMSNELMCFVYGPTSGGKGTIGGLIKKMFKGVLSFAKIQTLGGEYGKVPLLTKLMNYDAEMNISYLSRDTMGIMKHIVGMDGETSVNKKFTSQFMYDFDEFFFMSFGNQLSKLASTDVKAWFRRVWLVHFSKIQEPDPEMKEGILDEVDDWFTYLVNKEYLPIKTKGMDLEQFVEDNKAQWYQSAIPLISITEDLFEFTIDANDELNGDDVATWCSQELYKRGFYAPDRNKLKKEITNILGAVGVYTKRIENKTWYYNIKVKDIATQVKQIMQEKSDNEQRS